MLVTTVALVGAGAVVALWFLGRGDDAVRAEGCTATADGTAWSLSVEQADNAALLSGLASSRDLPARAVTIAVATALQESKLKNIDYGDRDSVGLFQQRPSQGWGTVEQIMDPVYSTGKFYDGLVRVPGYQEMEITQAAQAVQRSGFPEAYAQHEGRARAWASALTGWSSDALTCTLRPSGAPGSAEALTARLARDYAGTVPAPVPRPGTAEAGIPSDAVPDESPVVTIDLPATGDEVARTRAASALAQWSVAVADGQRLVAVAVADRLWTREDGAWTAAGTALPPGRVDIALAP